MKNSIVYMIVLGLSFHACGSGGLGINSGKKGLEEKESRERIAVALQARAQRCPDGLIESGFSVATLMVDCGSDNRCDEDIVNSCVAQLSTNLCGHSSSNEYVVSVECLLSPEEDKILFMKKAYQE